MTDEKPTAMKIVDEAIKKSNEEVPTKLRALVILIIDKALSIGYEQATQKHEEFVKKIIKEFESEDEFKSTYNKRVIYIINQINEEFFKNEMH